MEVKIQLVIDTYKDEIARLANENVLLKAQLRQLQNDSQQGFMHDELIPEDEGSEE